MATNNTRDEMLARGRAGRGDPAAPLITARRQSTFFLYAADGSFLGRTRTWSAADAADKWFRLYGETAHLVSEEAL